VASKRSNVDFVLEQVAQAGDVSARKMFGEYALYLRGKIIALFCDDQLFIKPTNAGRALLGKPQEAPPFPGAKLWFLISGDRCEDGDFLSELARVTERELPAPKPKKPRNPKKPKKAAKKAPDERKAPTRRKAPPKRS
jgi:TfoX/Sxy family transcriptional regulator of competence genes